MIVKIKDAGRLCPVCARPLKCFTLTRTPEEDLPCITVVGCHSCGVPTWQVAAETLRTLQRTKRLVTQRTRRLVRSCCAPVHRPAHRHPTCGHPDRLRPSSGVEDSDSVRLAARSSGTVRNECRP